MPLRLDFLANDESYDDMLIKTVHDGTLRLQIDGMRFGKLMFRVIGSEAIGLEVVERGDPSIYQPGIDRPSDGRPFNVYRSDLGWQDIVVSCSCGRQLRIQMASVTQGVIRTRVIGPRVIEVEKVVRDGAPKWDFGMDEALPDAPDNFGNR